MTASAEPRARRPIVAEIVGPAGSGKSTLFELLLASGEATRAPTLGRSRRAPLLARHAVAAFATVARRRALRGMTVERVLAMAYVQALPIALRRAGRAGAARAFVLDQGPVYFLSRPFVTRPPLRRWRERWLSAWRGHLDLVVWLDAPDDVLAARIRSRAKDHALKQSPEESAHAVLRASREAYEDALGRLSGAGGVEVLRFDTSAVKPEEIAAHVLPRLSPFDARAAATATAR